MTTIDVYVHGGDEQMYDHGRGLGLTGEALSMFCHACDEIKVTLEVDEATGLAKIVKVDGRTVSA